MKAIKYKALFKSKEIIPVYYSSSKIFIHTRAITPRHNMTVTKNQQNQKHFPLQAGYLKMLSSLKNSFEFWFY
jgi:hypothetical protein